MGRALIRQYQGVDRRRRLIEAVGFTPLEVPALASWFRLADAASVITGSGYSSVRDILDPSNPAVQSTDGRRPINQSASNGLPVMSFTTNHVLAAPLTAARNGATFWGMAGWVRPTNVSGAKAIGAVSGLPGGASAFKIIPYLSGSAVALIAYISGTDGRNAASPSAVVSAATWHFVTFEYDGSGATEADRNVITIGGVAQALTFSNIGAGGTTGALPTPTGNLLIGNQQDSGAASTPFVGLMGPNLYLFGSKMAGATSGLLTAAARTALMNFEVPT